MIKNILLFGLLCISSLVHAQNISGIINAYAGITNITSNVLTVNSSTGFAIGDKVMVIKMKGAQINQTNSASYGDTTNMGEAGKYIFSNIIAITPTTITLSPFCNVFANNSYLQVVTVPQYTNPTVLPAGIVCAPWDGVSGGILIFEASGILTLNGDVIGSFLGYRGGNIFGNVFSCNNANFYSAQAASSWEGKKGEGIADYIVGQECGRGKLANGGGGAASGNTGAGGGGNGGSGGNGGYEYSGCGTTVFSLGAKGIAHLNTALIMGGGGGGPQHDNGQTVYNGGNGGAIIYIKAAQIVSNGASIKSNGGLVPTISDEGSSAGGAGGSIYLTCPLYTGSLLIHADGGNGGSNNNTIFTTNCHGPGGGGSGGLVWFSTPTIPAAVTITKIGGNAGLILNPSSTCYNTNYNATNGDTGIVKFNFVPTPPPNPPNVFIGNDTTICAGTTITLDAGSGYTSYLWDNASNAQTRVINAPGIYYVTVTTGAGCTGSDTIKVLQNNSVQASFIPQIKLGCINDTVVFQNTSVGATQYIWNFGDAGGSTQTNPTHVYTNQAIYNVRLIAISSPCRDTIIIPIDIQHPLNAVFALTDSICITQNAIATSLSTPILSLHTWSWGDGTSITTTPPPSLAAHTYTNGGLYTVSLIITDTLGCADTTSRELYVVPATFVSFTVSDDHVCVGEPIFIQDSIAPHTKNFIWDFGDGSKSYNIHHPQHVYDLAGNYNITLTGQYGICPDAVAQVPIVVEPYPNVNLGRDTAICPGVTSSILLSDINNNASLFTWSTGETSNSIVVAEPGHYWVKATNGDCSVTDSIWIKRDCYLNIPNSFSPNGDGLNDYFLPRELLASGLYTFKMNIFNRWGENIFTTTKLDGRGWDGKYNGVVQPVGVYVYVIDAVFNNAIKKNFTGNVTLLR